MDEHFIECSRQKMEQLLQRPLRDLRLCALYPDGTWYRDQNLLVAMGLTCEGYKIPGTAPDPAENALVARELLADLAARGVDFAVPRLYVLDGSKGLAAAVRAMAGPAEGLEETLTVHRLRVGSILRETVASTNPLESAFSIVESVCRNVKAGKAEISTCVGWLLVCCTAETRFYRVRGYRQIPFLMKEIELAILKVAVPVIHAGVA